MKAALKGSQQRGEDSGTHSEEMYQVQEKGDRGKSAYEDLGTKTEADDTGRVRGVGGEKGIGRRIPGREPRTETWIKGDSG